MLRVIVSFIAPLHDYRTGYLPNTEMTVTTVRSAASETTNFPSRQALQGCPQTTGAWIHPGRAAALRVLRMHPGKASAFEWAHGLDVDWRWDCCGVHEAVGTAAACNPPGSHATGCVVMPTCTRCFECSCVRCRRKRREQEEDW